MGSNQRAAGKLDISKKTLVAAQDAPVGEGS